MRRWWLFAFFALCVGGPPSLGPAFAKPATVTLWQMDCGDFPTESDSCYLIRHNGTYMIWDMGLGADLLGRPPQLVHNYLVTLKTSLPQQLALVGLKPDDIQYIAVSHKHFDHIAQAASFPHATLLIGKEDWDDLVNQPSDLSDRFQPWIHGDASKILVTGDRDIFGDGTVVMLATPGHTRGHHSLLVRLRHSGAILLTGDLYSSHDQLRDQTIPPGTADVAANKDSYRRFNALAARLHATIIICHSRDDLAKLPAFPKAAT